MAGGKGGKGDHLPRGIAHVEFFYILGQHAIGGVRLDEDPLDPPPLNEIIHIGAAEGLEWCYGWR